MSAAVPGQCRADGLIDPGSIPGVDIKPDLIQQAADSFATTGTAVRDKGAAVTTQWTGLAGVYEAPEAAQLFDVMTPVGADTTALGDRLTSVSGALSSFAQTVAPIQKRLGELQLEAIAFVAQASGGIDVPPTSNYYPMYDFGNLPSSSTAQMALPAQHMSWEQYPPYVEHNNRLIEAVAAEATALDRAQTDCVNAIRALRSDMCVAPATTTDWSVAAGQGAVLPWGRSSSSDKTCLESYGSGIGDAAVGMVQGLGGLISYNAQTNQWGDWNFAGQAWTGLGQSLGAIALLGPAMPLIAMAPNGSVPAWMKDFATAVTEKQKQVVEGFIGTPEQWASNPAAAAGAVTFNVGTLFIPVGGEVAAGAKIASVGARVASVGVKVADAAELAGRTAGIGSKLVTTTGTTLVRVGDVLTEATTKLKTAVGDVGASAQRSLAEAIQRASEKIPSVRVVVDHVVTPDGRLLPGGVHVEVTHPVRADGAPGHGVTPDHGTAPGHWATPDRSAAPGHGAAPDHVLANADHAATSGGSGMPPLPDHGSGSGAGGAGTGVAPHDPIIPETVPGREVPVTPQVGTSEGGPGVWQEYTRRKGAVFQEQITGNWRSATGKSPEYRVNGVNFDGWVSRGEPPVDVYLEAKDGYRNVLPERHNPFMNDIWTRGWLKEADRQLAAIRSVSRGDARLEWYFSDADVARYAREFFANAGRPIDVYFVPKRVG